ncbi:unnamed protein product, partial [Effrenium voratum]
DRAMQLKQMMVVLACVRAGCRHHDWADSAGKLLQPKDVNLYHLVDLLVKP